MPSKQPPSADPSILDGVRVLDFSRLIAGPFAAQMLGDLGADVIKIEQPPGGDDARYYGRATYEKVGTSGVFASMNRNKRSVVLDLHRPGGAEVLGRLIESVDVIVHNFRPGVDERLGLDYEAASRLNPRIVHCGISGFGSSGPLREKAGNDLAVQAYSGLMGFTGEENGGPVRTPVSLSDMAAGMYAALGVVAALYDRERTGKGQRVETSLLESMLTLVGNHLADYLVTGQEPVRMGSANAMGQPNQAFQTRDGWIAISAVNDRMWVRCCEALEVPALAADSRFGKLADRYQNRREMIAELSAVVQRFTSAECSERLEAAGVTCAPIHSLEQVSKAPQVRALGALRAVPFGDRELTVVGPALRMSRTSPSVRRGIPKLGEHTEEVLLELGFGAEFLSRLRTQGTVL